MAQDPVVTGFFKRQEMLDSAATSPERLGKEARRLAEEGLVDEAITFFARAGDSAGLEEMLTRCRKDGDAFGFEAASRALGKAPSGEDWKELGGTALLLGKLWFAYRAFEKAENQEGLEAVRQRMVEEGVETPS